MPSHPILKQIALAIALGAIAVPAASARANSEPSRTAQSQTASASLPVRPKPDQQPGQAEASLANRPPSDGPCSEVCSAGGYSVANRSTPRNEDSGATLSHDPRPRSAVFATSSHGSLNANTPTDASPASCGDVCSGHGYGSVGPAAGAPPAITAPSDDFDYGAAALGAGITAAIAVLIAAGTLGLRQRGRTRHP